MHSVQRFIRSFPAIVFLSFIVLQAHAADTRFVVTLPAGTQQEVTGRVFIVISNVENPEPRLQVGSWRPRTELLGRAVQAFQPADAPPTDSLTLGSPSPTVPTLPPGR